MSNQKQRSARVQMPLHDNLRAVPAVAKPTDTTPIDETQYVPLLGCWIPKALNTEGIIRIGQGEWEFPRTPKEYTVAVHCEACGFALEAFQTELRYCSMCGSRLPVWDAHDRINEIRILQEVSEE